MAAIEVSSDTIAAIATPFGEGAVGIVRVSGPDSVSVVDKIFSSKNKKPLATQKSFRLRYGWIVREDGRPIDEVIVSFMRGPKSYTREDVVEINSHGGPRALASILELVLENGARLAQPGEFTKRAFLNGRLDLAQAEAVMDIIQAKSELALKSGLAQLGGEISKIVSGLRSSLLSALADAEAAIDFSDEETGAQEVKTITSIVSRAASNLQGLIERSFKGRIVREGLKAVICGRPNVGKSSLLNAILKQERAIVTPIAGTTRDTIEELVSIKGLAVQLIDTAGILEHRDEIEKEALERTRRALESSDLVLFILDASSAITGEDRALAKQVEPKKKIVVANKSDLKHKASAQEIEKLFSQKPIFVSALSGSNILALEDAIFSSIFEKPAGAVEGPLVSNIRHIEILKRAHEALKRAQDGLAEKLSLEFVAPDIKKALDTLGELTGEVFNDELLDAIFSKFCIGK